MIYYFLIVHHLRPSEIAAALAESVQVPVDAVDVADVDGDQDDRDWGAPVLCSYSATFGDVSLVLEIQIQESVSEQPTEPDLALRLAVQAATSVLYSAEEAIPSAHWVATPGGVVTRARVVESDDESPMYVVEAVEAPVPELPRARVMQLPEILREQAVPTPTTDAFVTTVAALRRAQGELVDPDLADEAGTAQDRARTALLLWERLVRRMESGWKPSGHYPAEMYADELCMRDKLARHEGEVPQVLSGILHQSIRELDGVFKEHTVEDGGHALAAVLEGSASTLIGRDWWWMRRPKNMPW